MKGTEYEVHDDMNCTLPRKESRLLGFSLKAVELITVQVTKQPL
jgi:hypothetical protein